MRYFIAIVGLIFLVIASVVFRSRPQYSGSLDYLEVRDTVEVLFDNYGVPHIYASSDEDAFKALGYVHAQDRLFQMEVLRRAGGGRLSEIFGPPLKEVDRMFKTFGIPQKAIADAQRAAEDSQADAYRLANAYLEGINRYVDEGRTPLEFSVGNIPLSHFSYADMHLIAGAMSFNFAQGLRTDPVLSYIQEELGREYLSDLQIDAPADNVNVPVYPPKRIPNPRDTSNMLHIQSPAMSQYLDLGVGTFYGSNTWAIAPKLSEDGGALLANDTHIGYAQPCTWYEAHLEYPGQRIYGNFMAGIPFPLTAHTDFHAWGVTMLLDDEMDLYREELTSDSSSYMYKGSPNKLWTRQDTVRVKGEDEIVFTVKGTHHGPIVSDFVAVKDSSDVISLSWTYMDHDSNLLEAFYNLGVANSMSEARDAVAMIAAPGLNISYADTDGNIALWAAAQIRERPEHVSSKFILDGASGNNELIGYLPFDENPSLENPPWGYVYSCNNQHDNYFDFAPVAGYYEPDDRASRVDMKLSSRRDWSIEAMKRLSLDDYSDTQVEIKKVMLDLVKPLRDEMTDVETDAFELLREWDGHHGVDVVGPNMHYRWLYHTLRLAMADEMGKKGFEELLKVNALKQSILGFMQSSDSPWWDDVRTEEKEFRNELVVRAWKLTLKEMTDSFGDQVVGWTWGRSHQTLHAHAFKDVPLIGRWLNVGPYPSPGGVETVNNSMFYLTDDDVIHPKHGPQMRRMIDLLHTEQSLSILPTGQSGARMSPHYDDQAEMYIEGKFRPQHMSRKRILRDAERLVFLPQ